MIDEKTEDLLRRTLTEQSEEALGELARHLQRSGRCPVVHPRDLKSAGEILSEVKRWQEEEGRLLAERITDLLGSFGEETLVYLTWRPGPPMQFIINIALHGFSRTFSSEWFGEDRCPNAPRELDKKELVDLIRRAVMTLRTHYGHRTPDLNEDDG